MKAGDNKEFWQGTAKPYRLFMRHSEKLYDAICERMRPSLTRDMNVLVQRAFFPAVVGFWLGILFLLVLDRTVPHLHWNSSQPEGPHTRLKRTTMLVLAATLHNIP